MEEVRVTTQAPTVALTEPTAPPWVVLADSSTARRVGASVVNRGRVIAPVLLGSALVLLLVGFSGTVAARRLAEKESVHEAATNAAVVADSVVQPALSDGLADGDRAAFARMDRAVRRHVLGASSVRVKIWTADGRIVYSDEPRLVGRTFPLGEDERGVFAHPVSRAEVSDLEEPENAYERGKGKLLEVYRPVWTPDGTPLLFETYAPYDDVSDKAGQLWRGFGGITLSSLLGLLVLMVPVVWSLLGRLRSAQAQRETLLERAVDASADERRRIAGTLHDGVVQELAGASFSVSSAAARARELDQPVLADQLGEAAETVRRSIAGMRSLLVDIYPPNLAVAGLVVALEDLTTSLRSRDVDVSLDIDPDTAGSLDADQQRMVYRVVHECLLNSMRHARAGHVTVTLVAVSGAALLEVTDDGAGFDALAVVEHPPEGHFGLRVLSDVARDAGADLRVSSAAGFGTRWQLRVRRR
jgi:signal transduction histidine kinase